MLLYLCFGLHYMNQYQHQYTQIPIHYERLSFLLFVLYYIYVKHFQLLYYCGLRIGELKGLTWKDIDFENKTVSINNKQITKQSNRENWRFVPPKTKKSNKVLPLTKVLLNDLKTLKESDKEILFGFNDKFFVVGDIAPASNNRFSDRKNKNCEKAGVKQIRLHDFRHSCASLLINNGANVTLVAKYLGHTKIEETLNTYSHMFSTALDSVVSVIDSLEDDKTDD